jgi:hypothetical protein
VAAALAVAAIAFPASSLPSQAAIIAAAPPAKSAVKTRYLTSHFPDKPSLPPVFSIPLVPLGFVAPSNNYLGTRNSFVSLDFLDEDRLLFTFRVPMLIHRDREGGDASDARRIRAMVLELPEGTIEAEALWTVHDRARYLWPLKDGRFFLRDRNSLFVGDSALTLKPFLDFPGPLLWLEMDPAQQFIVANSHEPVPAPAKTAAPADGSSSTGLLSGQAGSPSTASATATTDQDPGTEEVNPPQLVVRILRRGSGEVMLVSRARAPVHLPINTVGYLENLRGRGLEWTLNLNYFAGGSRMLGALETACDPDDEFLSENEFLVTGCGSDGSQKLIAMTTEGRTLWISQAPPTQLWPRLTVAPNGSRLAWITLDTNRQMSTFAPMDNTNVKEQSVTVFDAATGDIAFVSPVNPILDAGGNVALSPSGGRLAIINAGAIQVFDLPTPTPSPAAK